MREVIWITVFLALACGVVESAPSSDAIDAIANISQYNVLDFYQSLKSLYLSGGFDMTNDFNQAILKQEVIPQVIWNQMIFVVNQTQQEIKNGDFSMKRMDAMIKMYDPSTLKHEIWLSKLALEIAKNSKYPKDLAFAIRDLGAQLVDLKLTQTDYTNGTYLRKTVTTWLTNQALDFGKDLPALLVNVHHTIGPENFGLLGDVLEVLPYQVKGMYNCDADPLGYYAQNIFDEILDADIGAGMTAAFRKAFRNLTKATEAETTDSFLYSLSTADIEATKSSITIGTLGNLIQILSGKPAENRYTRSAKTMVSLLNSKLTTDRMGDFGVLAGKYLNESIESVENIRMAVIAGARLILNLGSIDNAISLAEKVILAVKTDNDIRWKRRVNGALEIIKYLPKTPANSALTGGQIFLKAFLNESKLFTKAVFLNTKASEESTMLQLFDNMKKVDQKVLGQVAAVIVGWTSAELENKLAEISKVNRLATIQNVFGAKDVTSDADAINIVAFLNSVVSATVSPSNYEDMCSSFSTISVNVTDYSNFIQAFVDFIPLSRDSQWQDVWNALFAASSTLFASSKDYKAVLDPISYVVNLDTKMPLINLREIFLALQQLSVGSEAVVKAKVQFLKDFYSNFTMENYETILQGFDVSAAGIADKVNKAMYVDDFLDVLESSGSQAGLWALLKYHGSYTTVLNDPAGSLQRINEMIIHLQERMSLVSGKRRFMKPSGFVSMQKALQSNS